MKRGCRKPTKKVEATPEVKSAEKLSTNVAAEAEVSKPWFDEDTELAVCAILRCAGGLSIVEWKATDRSMSLETFVTADRESYDLDYANVLRALGNEVPWLSTVDCGDLR